MNILLHTCCSNCAIYPFKILASEGHSFTGFWFNPNIHPLEEYTSRLGSLKRLASMENIDMLLLEDYRPEEFFDMFGLSGNMTEIKEIIAVDPQLIPQSPERCRSCYELRLGRTAEEASRKGFDAFSTTLLISPYQDFEQIEATGREMADRHNVKFFMKDFRPHFRDAMASAKELNLYRQKYCGCLFSKAERKERSKIKGQN